MVNRSYFLASAGHFRSIIVDYPASSEPHVTTIPATIKNDPEVQVHAGVAYSPDGRLIYDATATRESTYELLGLGPLNLEDVLAADMSDMFTSTPDPAPFVAQASDKRVFGLARARFAKPKNKEEARRLREGDYPRLIEGEFRKK
jgi:hypothetical protein